MLAAEDKTTQGQTVSEFLDGNFIIPAKDVLLSIIKFMELTLDLHQQRKTHGNISIDNLVIHKEKGKPPVVSLRDLESAPTSASNDIYTNVRAAAIVIKTMLEHASITARFETESEKIKELQQDFLEFANDTIKKINVEQMASAAVLHDLMNKIPEIEAKESHVSEQKLEESFTETVKAMKGAFNELYPSSKNDYKYTDVYITIAQQVAQEQKEADQMDKEGVAAKSQRIIEEYEKKAAQKTQIRRQSTIRERSDTSSVARQLFTPVSSSDDEKDNETARLQQRVRELEEQLTKVNSQGSFMDDGTSRNNDKNRGPFQSQLSASVFPTKKPTAFEVAQGELKAAATAYIKHSQLAKSEVTSRQSETSSSGASAGWGLPFNIFTSPGKHGKKGETNATALVGNAEMAENIHDLKVAVQEVANAYWLLGLSQHSLVSFIGPKTNLLAALGVSPDAYKLPEGVNDWHSKEAKPQRAILLAALKNLSLEITAKDGERLSEESQHSR